MRQIPRQSRNLSSLFTAQYDAVHSCTLAEEYQYGDECTDNDLNTLLISVAPLARIVLYREFSDNHLENEYGESLCCDALSRAYKLLETCSVPTSNHKVFSAFLYVAMKRAMLDSMRITRQEWFNFDYECKRPPLGNILDYTHVESYIQFNQLLSIVQAIFFHDCKYTGNSRLCCVHMSKCILGIDKGDPLSTRYRYNITRLRAQKLLIYTRILLKCTMYTVRSLNEVL